jgi:methyl-accepting chemotaxis protein
LSITEPAFAGAVSGENGPLESRPELHPVPSPEAAPLTEIPVDVFARLGDLTEALTGVGRAIEPDVLRLGEELQVIHVLAQDLIDQAVSTVDLIGGDTGRDILNRVVDLAQESVADGRASRDRIQRDLDLVEASLGNLVRLQDVFRISTKIAKSLRMVSVNVAVESARTDRTRQMFAAFSHEITLFAENVVSITAGLHQDAKQARSREAAAHRRMKADVVRLEGNATQTETHLTDAVRATEKLLESSTQTLSDAGRHASEIARQIGDLVVGLQFHDNMSQRLEHIGLALTDVRDQWIAPDVTGQSQTVNCRTIVAVIELQAAQLAEVISLVDSVYSQGHLAYDRIMVEAGNLAESISAVGTRRSGPGRNAGQNGSDGLSALSEILRKLDRHLDQGRELIDRMRAAAAETAQTSARLSEHVQGVMEINEDMALMAINAVIKAANFGAEGRGLAVLAQEVQKLSISSRQFVQEVEEVLEAIGAASADVAASAGPEEADRSTSSLKESLARLEDSFTRFMDEAGHTFERARTLEQNIGQTRHRLDFIPDLVERLSRELGRLRDLARELLPWAGSAEDTAAETIRLAERYTMHQERSVHEQIIGGGGAPADQTPMADAPESGDLNDDNVELF